MTSLKLAAVAVASLSAMQLPDEDTNPAFDEGKTHVCTARVAFVDGKLCQLWWPTDRATHDPEWRAVEAFETVRPQNPPAPVAPPTPENPPAPVAPPAPENPPAPVAPPAPENPPA